MKKIVLLLVFGCVSFFASAQDTVRYGDPWYMFNPKPALFDDATVPYGSWGNIHTFNSRVLCSNYEIIQIFPLDHDSVTIYGVAVTMADTLNNDIIPRDIVLFRMLEDGYMPTLEVVDSIDSLTFLEYGRTCYFEYQFDTPTLNNRRAISREYYFAHPRHVALPVMTDTFCIGIYNSSELSEFVGRNIKTGPIYDYALYISEGTLYVEGNWLFGSEGNCYRKGNTHEGSLSARQLASHGLWSYHTSTSKSDGWGLMFPIIGLRCAKPYLWVEERGSTEARVRWTQAEAGIEYEVAWGRYGAEPDSCPSVLLTDTTFALTGLEPGSRNAVWVRKACHYATPGYDTVVWSEWSRPTVFLTLGVGEAEEAGVSVTARRGAVEVSCAEADAAVQVYDMAGRRIAAARTKADSPLLLPVPAAGVYTVRVGSGPAHKVVVF